MTKLYLGIDLGTTNSAAAVFDGEQTEVIPNKRGQANTPSVVRIAGDKVTVGDRARKFLESDAANTHREFKRLMGTGKLTAPDSAGKQWSPEQLSAEVLKTLLDDTEAATGTRPSQAVITVPALFELPQSKATSEAAHLAGLEKIELLPEPVASAFSAGWSEDSVGQSWLVFDLGGGTFDASLVEARDGLLRVIGHDGDNFLGGRDIDRLLVDWVVRQLETNHQVQIPIDDPTHKSLAAKLYSEAEQAKIRLSTQTTTMLEIDLELDGEDIVDELPINREELELLCEPVISRALEICRRLLAEHGLNEGGLDRTVLVGGPAHMPVIRNRITAELAPLVAEDRNPMTLVAEGAALYAVSIGLVSENEKAAQPASSGCKFWLQYPNVCSELDPTVMGRLVSAEGSSPAAIQFVRDGWEGEKVSLNQENAFLTSVSIQPSKATRFAMRCFDANDKQIPAHPETVSIMHGLTLSDPPLSRSIGVALANGYVKTFLERGTPLPARRTFSQSTIDTLMPGTEGELNIPIVQGERAKARYCRRVGNLVIRARDLKKPLYAGSKVEISLEVDRGGNMESQATLPDQNLLIKGVAELVIPSADPQAMRAMWQSLQQRGSILQQDAFRERNESMVRQLERQQQHLGEIGVQLAGAMEDEDTRQRLYRNLLELEAEVEELEQRGQIDELRDQCETEYLNAQYSVMQWGSDTDKRLFADLEKKMATALERGRVTELERIIEQMERINHAAYRKSPEYWADQFHHAASRLHEARDMKRAKRLVEQGHSLLEQDKPDELRGITQSLWALLPDRIRAAEDTHDSGVF
ncbi:MULTISPECIES: Hsp70 family protein [unclassified Microbulbifer]|uniref:Hsp70 family protein n=1 Tax=unclassified Microbulbifer TaxID=2619833 RepID=UPI0027E57F8D|nr:MULTISPECIES: Hsp70 family protein [unclassified Microbulbifer]